MRSGFITGLIFLISFCSIAYADDSILIEASSEAPTINNDLVLTESSSTEPLTDNVFSTTSTESVDESANVGTGTTTLVITTEPLDEASTSEAIITEDVSVEALASNFGINSFSGGEYLSGELVDDKVLLKDEGPYFIDNLVIGDNAVLTIEAGSEVYVNGEIVVLGKIDVVGDSSNPVKIVSSDGETRWSISTDNAGVIDISGADIYDLDGIYINGGELNINASTYRSGSIIANNRSKIKVTNSIFSGGDFIQAVDHSDVLVQNTRLFDIGDGITLVNSNLSIDNLEATSIYGSLGKFYNGSNASINNLKVLNCFDEYGYVFESINSDLIINSASIDNFKNSAILLVGGSLQTNNLFITHGNGDGIDAFPYQSITYNPPNITATELNISDLLGTAIFTTGSIINIDGAEFYNNLMSMGMFANQILKVAVHNSSFLDPNSVVLSVNDNAGDLNVDLSNNWWNDETGPWESNANPDGKGGSIVLRNLENLEKVIYKPWLNAKPKKRNPLIIIPGIMASQLVRNDDRQKIIWLNLPLVSVPLSDSFLDELSLSYSGYPDTSHELLLPDDLLRKVLNKDFFDAFIKSLEDSGYKEGKDLFVFPYDWRLDIKESVDAPYTSAVVSLKSKIDDVLSKTGAKKVDIVAHSMGGLLTKYYLSHYGASKVDKFIDVATPHLGSPESSLILLFGDDVNIRLFGFSILNKSEVKKISQNMPSVYELLPSRKYFSDESTDYKYYIDDLSDFDKDGVKGKLDFSQSMKFLENTGRNQYLLNMADRFHSLVDNFDVIGSGVDSYNIIGCGTPTIGQIYIEMTTNGDNHYDLLYTSGDGTVPRRSAEYLKAKENYYVNGVTHATILSNPEVYGTIGSILKGESPSAASSSVCTMPKGKVVEVHSPINLDIYDAEGHHVGINQEGGVDYEIPNITYDVIDGNKFAFIPDDLNVRVSLLSTGIGSFSADIKEVNGGLLRSSKHFSNISLPSIGIDGEVILNEYSIIMHYGGRRVRINPDSDTESGESVEVVNDQSGENVGRGAAPLHVDSSAADVENKSIANASDLNSKFSTAISSNMRLGIKIDSNPRIGSISQVRDGEVLSGLMVSGSWGQGDYPSFWLYLLIIIIIEIIVFVI